MTLSCSNAQRTTAKKSFAQALTKCSGGNIFVNPERILETPHWGKETKNFDPEIISQEVGKVYMPKGCVDYSAQAQESVRVSPPEPSEATPTESSVSDPLLEGLSGGRQHSHRHEHECITQDSNTGNYIITKLEHDHSHGVSSEDDNKQHAYPHLHAEYCQPKPIDSFDVKPNQGGVVRHGLNFN